MSLTTVKRRFPLFESGLPSWFETNAFFDDDFFNHAKNLPAMNVKENEKNFEIELAIPGFSKDEIEISMEDDKLRVWAHQSKETVEENVEGYTRKEFSYDEFERNIQLPSTVNTKKTIKAVYENGVLRLTLPKAHTTMEAPKKRIEIL